MSRENASGLNRRGRTCLFVSHNLSAVLSICNKGVFLQNGRIITAGKADEVCSLYNATPTVPRRAINGSWLLDIHLCDDTGISTRSIVEGDNLNISLKVRVPEETFKLALILRNEQQVEVVEMFDETFLVRATAGKALSLSISAGKMPLLPGTYSLDLWVADRFAKTLRRMDGVYEFQIMRNPASKDVVPVRGLIGCRSDWRIEHEDVEDNAYHIC